MKMSLHPLLLLTAAMGLMVPGHSLGHARFLATSGAAPRNTADNLKTAPCGGVPRTATPTALVAGSTLTLRWQETIQHRGTYYIDFAENGDTNFQRMKTIPDVQDAPISQGQHLYTDTVTVPNVNCTNCTIRLIQEMRDNAANPAAITGYYYSCADITISGAVSGGGGGNNSGGGVGPTVPDDYGNGTDFGDTCHAK